MMKNVFLLFLFMTGCLAGKADTIDFWHVYKNGVKIKECNQFGTHELVLKLSEIKNSDSITVKYFRDTPCHDCPTYLTAEDEKHHVVVMSKGKGTFNPVSFALKDLLEYRKATGKNTFEVYYKEGDNPVRSSKQLVLRISME